MSTPALPPLRGAILIGGASTRMGSPKHLLTVRGQTLLERLAAVLSAALSQTAGEVVIVGAGALPPPLAGNPRVADAPGLAGPIAGLLALTRTDPHAAWLACACDLPLLSTAALRWLARQRAAKAIAVLPRTAHGVQPLPGVYEPQAAAALSALAPGAGPRELALRNDVRPPPVPPELARAWRNVNTPADWADALRDIGA